MTDLKSTTAEERAFWLEHMNDRWRPNDDQIRQLIAHVERLETGVRLMGNRNAQLLASLQRCQERELQALEIR